MGDKAWLVSEVLESPKGACLEFWYHMKGGTTGNLTVLHRNMDKQPTTLWSKEVNRRISGMSRKYMFNVSIQGDQGDNWLNGKIDIPVTNDHYNFIFEGVVVCILMFFIFIIEEN